MNDIAVTIITPIAAIMAITLGYTIGRLLDLRARLYIQQRTLDLLEPPDTKEPEKKRRLYLIKGGLSALTGAAALGIKQHRRAIAAATLAAAAASITAAALLGHAAPPIHHAAPPPRTPHHSAGTAFTRPLTPPPAPTTNPGSTHRSTVPALPVVPVRTRRASQTPATVNAPPDEAPTPAPAAPSPSRSPAPSATPSPSPSPASGCPIRLTLRLGKGGITLCV